jgi:DNA-binding NarL/FixJ family response regulator
MTDRPVRVLIADDHPVVREGLHVLLGTVAAVTVVGLVETSEHALRAVIEGAVDVVLMDLSMPAMGGIEATRRITRAVPTCRVLVLTTHHDDASLRAAIEAGASGYLLKTSGLGEIVGAIAAVHRGQLVFGGGVAGTVARLVSDEPPATRPFPHLTTREFEVLALLAQGLANDEIAARLGLSGKTVGNNLSRVFLKLGGAHRVEAALLARENGLGG